MCTRRLLTLGGSVAVSLLIAASAFAQLSKEDQKCIDQYNNKLRLVSQTSGKDYRKCVKNAGKGKEADPDTCVKNDTPGKISGKTAKVDALFAAGGKCDPVPAVIVQSAAVGNQAHIDGTENLTFDLFGDPVSGVVSPGKDEAKCQDKAIQRSMQLFTEKVKVFRKCKKDGMKAGTVTDAATLETECLTPTIPDPKSKISKKATKLTGDVGAACTGVSIATLFPGVCSGSANATALGDCIERQTECRVCETLNAADGTARDCDLFDDGLANGSCVTVVEHKCVLDNTPAASQIQIHIAALPIPLVFPLVGALDLGAGGTFTTCGVQTLDPINIPMIGNVCITGTAGCDPGSRHCGPGAGPALGIDVSSDGNIGACTSNADCETTCAAACGALTATGQCTGFCSDGAEGACTNDAACLPNDGACNGPDPVLPAQQNICQCACTDVAAHGASDPGDLQCNLGSSLNVETSAPCDGTDITIAVGQTCIPLSTQRATSSIIDANFTPASVVPPPPNVNDQTGAPLACATFDSSTTTGLVGVGAVNFFGSALGDLAVGLKATCQ
jgi:hypothetical protein